MLLALARRKGFAVPDGFVVLRKTFGDLVRDTELKLRLPPLEKRLIARSGTMEQLALELRELIRSVAVPRHILLDIESGCRALGLGSRTLGKAVTVRASPVDERLASAPLERAVAVTRVAEVESRVKVCWASAFDAANLEAIRHFGIPLEEAAPSVLVMETVPAEVSGLMFSEAPGATGEVLIEAVWGFHEALTEGKFEPSRYFVARAKPGELRAQESEQRWEYALGPQSAMVRREVSPDRAGKPKLQRLQVDELLRSTLELEKLVGAPVGVEWAIHGGVIFLLQVVPLAIPPPHEGEEGSAERYIRAVEVAEAALDVPRPHTPPPARTSRAPPPEAPEAPGAPTARGAKPPPTEPAAAQGRPRLLPVIETSLFVELPPGASAREAAHIPHAGLVIDVGKPPGRPDAAEGALHRLAEAAAVVFPRPVLVELSDLDPAAYEALRERSSGRDALSDAELGELLGGVLDELRLVRRASEETGATNLHVIAPQIKAAGDAKAFRLALKAAGLGADAGPRTLVFSELRSPSTLLFNVEFAREQDGVLVRAGRFYRALMQEAEAAPPDEAQRAGGAPDLGGRRSESFVQALMQVTRAFERTGGSVLVVLETESDLETLWFYEELGVAGYIAPLGIAQACAAAIAALEGKRTGASGRRGRRR